MAEINVKKAVQESYGAIAREVTSDSKATAVAEAFGYNHEELSQLPEGANMGLSCGNPLALASLKQGETVVDLGSGGGIDCFLASKKIGPSGKAIGIDMTPAMIEKARKSAEKGGYKNVEFRLGEIENMPIDAGTVDCVISNCVINLVPNKQRAYNECFRILKPGGRFAMSDIAFKKPLPEPFANNIKYWTGCIAGAQTVDEMRAQLKAAGFAQIDIIDSKSDLNVYKSEKNSSTEANKGGCCQPSASACCQSSAPSCCKSDEEDRGCGSACAVDLPGAESLDLNEFVMSVKVFAVKPK